MQALSKQKKEITVVFLQPPSPPFMDVDREAAAGYGLASPNSRACYGHNRSSFLNLTLAQTAGVVHKAGWHTVFIDGQAEKLNLKELVKRLQQLKPDFLVAYVTLPSLKGDLKLLAEVKRELPTTYILTVGTISKVLTKTLVKQSFIDAVVVGEAEVTVKKIIKAVMEQKSLRDVSGVAFQSGNKVIINHTTEFTSLDDLPLIPYQLLPISKYRGEYFAAGQRCLPVYSSKGCPFTCSYCHSPVGFGPKVRFRSVENFVFELELLSRHYDVNAFIFRDQNFTLNQERAEAICDLILKKKLAIKWCCETRLSLAKNKRLLEKMSLAGCQKVVFGLESGDPELFEKVGKPGSRFSQIKTALETVQQAGIQTHLHVIVGLPGEDWRSIRKTAKFLNSLPNCTFNFNLLIPFPGTPFFQEAKKKGLILTTDWSKYDGNSVVVRTEKLSALELKLALLFLQNAVNGFTLHRALARRLKRSLAKALSFVWPKIQEGS